MTDEQIIALFNDRDQAAIELLKNKYKKLCLGISRRILSDSRDIEECISDTYMKLWSSIPPEKPVNLKAYIARIARNCAIDRYFYNSAGQRSTALTSAFEELEPSLQLDNCDPQQITEDAELKQFINRFLRTRTAEARRFFILRYWYGESIGEIAEKCHVTQSKVKSSLFRTRQQLRLGLEKENIHI